MYRFLRSLERSEVSISIRASHKSVRQNGISAKRLRIDRAFSNTRETGLRWITTCFAESSRNSGTDVDQCRCRTLTSDLVRSLGFRFPETYSCEERFWRNRPHPRSSRIVYDSFTKISSLVCFCRFFFPRYYSLFFPHTFISSFFATLSVVSSRISPSSSARPSFALRDPIFLLAPLSFSLPGLPRRHHPPLSRPVLPRPPASAVRDTSSRMSKGDEMRRLVGFHGYQPACTGISRLNHRRLSHCRSPREPTGQHGGNRRNRTRTRGIRLFWISSGAVIGERTASVYFQAAVIPILRVPERSAFVVRDRLTEWWKCFG